MPKRARSGAGQQSGSGGRADQRESLDRQLDRARARPLADHDVELVILHRRDRGSLRSPALIRWISSMKSTSRSCRFVSIAARSPAFSITGPAVARIGDAELVGDDGGERGLAESRRPVQQHVIERLAALRGGRDRDVEVFAYALLADVLVERPRPEPRLVLRILVVAAARADEASLTHPFISPLQHFAQRMPRSLLRSTSLHDRVDGLFRQRTLIAEIHQRRQQVVAELIFRTAASQSPARRRSALPAADPSARGRCARRSSCRCPGSPSAARHPGRGSRG